MTLFAKPRNAISAAEDIRFMQRDGAMDRGVTLVFPAVNQSAVDYLADATERSEPVMAAASAFGVGISAAFGQLLRLPMIYDPDFEYELKSLITAHGITRVYCPVAAVHDFMAKRIALGEIPLTLIGKSPIQRQVDQHRALIERAKPLHAFAGECAEEGECCSLLEVASMLKHAAQIYGESNDDKLAAMVGIFASAPKGDVVEIGSLMGRSAFVLQFLSGLHSIGPLLTVDPWQAFNAVQHDSPEQFQSLVDVWDFEVLAQGFTVNALPYGIGCHAHLRMASEQGYGTYAGSAPITGLSGSTVAFSKSIAVLHIDGNHDFAQVARDVELWAQHLVPGGWLILDDYLWAHGDGPHRVGDRLLQESAGRIARAFVCGKALFMRFS